MEHKVLIRLPGGKLEHRGIMAILAHIIAAGRGQAGRGLSIGALKSQLFANFYLAGGDQHPLENCWVRGRLRYRDDLVSWGESRGKERQELLSVETWRVETLRLELQYPVGAGQSCHGLVFCSFRARPGRSLLSRSLERHYAALRAAGFLRGSMYGIALRSAFTTTALDVTGEADATARRWQQRRQSPLEPPLAIP